VVAALKHQQTDACMALIRINAACPTAVPCPRHMPRTCDRRDSWNSAAKPRR